MSNDELTPAEAALEKCEAENWSPVLSLLTDFDHPLSDDPEFRNEFCAVVRDVLISAAGGEEFIVGVQPEQMGVATASWVAEWASFGRAIDMPEEESKARETWLSVIHREFSDEFGDHPP